MPKSTPETTIPDSIPENKVPKSLSETIPISVTDSTIPESAPERTITGKHNPGIHSRDRFRERNYAAKSGAHSSPSTQPRECSVVHDGCNPSVCVGGTHLIAPAKGALRVPGHSGWSYLQCLLILRHSHGGCSGPQCLLFLCHGHGDHSELLWSLCLLLLCHSHGGLIHKYW